LVFDKSRRSVNRGLMKGVIAERNGVDGDDGSRMSLDSDDDGGEGEGDGNRNEKRWVSGTRAWWSASEI
jgi:hypothetical protein